MRLPVGLHSEVDASVAAESEDAVDLPGEILHLLRLSLPEGSLLRPHAHLALVAIAPFDLVRRDEPRAPGSLSEVELPNGEGRESLVSEHAHVELSSFDELLADGVAADAVVHEANALLELRRRRDHGGLGDPYRAIEDQRLHDQRKRKLFRRLHRLAP